MAFKPQKKDLDLVSFKNKLIKILISKEYLFAALPE
jgi:hypothetical protein